MGDVDEPCNYTMYYFHVGFPLYVKVAIGITMPLDTNHPLWANRSQRLKWGHQQWRIHVTLQLKESRIQSFLHQPENVRWDAGGMDNRTTQNPSRVLSGCVQRGIDGHSRVQVE